MKFRKKPVVIEAWHYEGNLHGRPDWIEEGLLDRTILDPVKGDYLVIKTLEGEHHASVGDYIIQGVKGELCPCKSDIFEATYEPIPHEEPAQLKPCPFCGGEAIMHTVEPHSHYFVNMPDYPGSTFIECVNCTCGISASTEQEAKELWNRGA